MFIPLEASFLTMSSLRKLRSSIFKVVWSRRQPLANVGAVFSLLDGPQRCDPAYRIVWFRVRMIGMYLAYCWIWSGKGTLGMAPSICWLPVPMMLGFSGIRMCLGVRPGLLVLSNLAGPIQRFKSAMLHAWRDKVTADHCARKGWYPAAP